MMDNTLTYVVDYFGRQLGYYMAVALDLAKLIMLIGVIWSSIQVAFGTMEVRKAYVGYIVKFFLFLVIMHFYPGFTNGLMNATQDIAIGASGQSTGQILEDFKGRLEEYSELSNMYSGNTGKKQKKQTETFNKKMSAVTKCISKDNMGKWHLNLYATHETPWGSKYRYLSPDAIFNVVLISAEIMRENEWAFDVVANSQNEGVFGNKKSKSKLEKMKQESDINGEHHQNVRQMVEAGNMTVELLHIDFGAFFRYGLCLVACVGIIVLTLGCLVQYIMCLAEWHISCAACGLFIPFMLMDGLKDFASKVITALFAQAIKMLMITTTLFWAVHAFACMADNVMNDGAQFGFVQFAMVIFTGIVVSALTANAPKIAQTICNGTPNMSMGEFAATAAGVGAAAAFAGKHAAQAGRLGFGAAGAGGRVLGAGLDAAKQTWAQRKAAMEQAVTQDGGLGERMWQTEQKSRGHPERFATAGALAGSFFAGAGRQMGREAKGAAQDFGSKFMSGTNGNIFMGTAFKQTPGAKRDTGSGAGKNQPVPPKDAPAKGGKEGGGSSPGGGTRT